ncbi:YihY/virulence factor BrkB family protein [Aeromicrobium wangtongii]|uniref:YihY/virulence factor BrkB family protein n=1 Tax=Aeromicrobium wangtongii TaxID=2969247 RepID=A0ABY5MDZ6_9ACTN|nr:YihY/virulence factor BrkB family protein [Aeromicrobium wangtongii]MCD9197981.1 YihY/virulence factor BrkB family protein [Aeromicrobium wangtongii]UUP15459.1 YihY/virulence factor BrkB family protein [Aeromicrobium wangtongii]
MTDETRDVDSSRHAADPEDDRKPDSPADLHKRSWLYVFKKTIREFSKDQCTDLAAALTYYSVLALFPAIVALVSLLGVFGQGQSTVDSLLKIVDQIGPSDAVDTLRPTIERLTNSQSAGIALVVGLVGAIWSASGYVGAFGRAMNRVYEIPEGRPIWKLRPLQLVITLFCLILVAVAASALVLTGPVAKAVGDQIGLGSTAIMVWDIAKWPVLLLVVVVIVAVLYYATPNVKQPKFRWISVGAVFAIVVWIIASALFGLYVAMFSSYDKTYGSLAGVIVFLLWLWLTNLALLFGAELDAELERGRQLQAGIKAEETIQLPPRDTRNIEKAQKKHDADVADGRELRKTAGRGTDDD